MDTNFRSEVFNLCKKIKNNEEAKNIRALIHDLSNDSPFPTDKDRTHDSLGYIAKHYNNHFYGYLIVDDYFDTMEFPLPLSIKHLSKDERNLIERGHITLINIIDSCLSEIKSKSSIAADLLNPYFGEKSVKINPEIQPLVMNDDIKHIVNTFKSGNVYQALINSDLINLFGNINCNKMHLLINTMSKEINMSFDENASANLNRFMHNLTKNHLCDADITFAFVILFCALRESIRMTCQLIFNAICGDELIVLNNNNIINIEERSSNSLYNRYKILIQGSTAVSFGNALGSILLISCDTMENEKIHVFGMIISISFNTSIDYGDTTKFTIITVNEEMINICPLVNRILQIGLPKYKFIGNH